MLPIARTRLATFSAARFVARASYSSTVPRFSENRMQPNDPNPPTATPNVSATNATPVDSMGSWDHALQEEPEVGERTRHLQAPNRARTWAASQQPREQAMTGPRFEQTIMELQVRLT
jgi:NADH dehydrogenase (ubiquinone) Fe-S protein 6